MAQNPSISYVAYIGNKDVRARESGVSGKVENELIHEACLMQTMPCLLGWGDAV